MSDDSDSSKHSASCFREHKSHGCPSKKLQATALLDGPFEIREVLTDDNT